MTESSEISKALCKVLAEIAERERKKAVQDDNYGDALVASIFEGIFREAERSFK